MRRPVQGRDGGTSPAEFTDVSLGRLHACERGKDASLVSGPVASPAPHFLSLPHPSTPQPTVFSQCCTLARACQLCGQRYTAWSTDFFSSEASPPPSRPHPPPIPNPIPPRIITFGHPPTVSRSPCDTLARGAPPHALCVVSRCVLSVPLFPFRSASIPPIPTPPGHHSLADPSITHWQTRPRWLGLAESVWSSMQRGSVPTHQKRYRVYFI